jgi:hypothetical protein
VPEQAVAGDPAEAGRVDPGAVPDVPSPVTASGMPVSACPAVPSVGADVPGITHVLFWQTNDGPG